MVAAAAAAARRPDGSGAGRSACVVSQTQRGQAGYGVELAGCGPRGHEGRVWRRTGSGGQ